jgi:hypothetical protein
MDVRKIAVRKLLRSVEDVKEILRWTFISPQFHQYHPIEVKNHERNWNKSANAR